MYTPVNPSFSIYISGVRGGQNYIGMFSFWLPPRPKAEETRTDRTDRHAPVRRRITIFFSGPFPVVNISFPKIIIRLLKNTADRQFSWLSLSRTRLSRITTYLEVKIWSLPKHENLTTCKTYCGKEEKGAISPLFHNIFNISLTSSPIKHIFVKCG